MAQGMCPNLPGRTCASRAACDALPLPSAPLPMAAPPHSPSPLCLQPSAVFQHGERDLQGHQHPAHLHQDRWGKEGRRHWVQEQEGGDVCGTYPPVGGEAAVRASLHPTPPSRPSWPTSARSGLAAAGAHHPARHPARRGGAGGAVRGARGRGVEPQRGQRPGGGAHARGRLVGALRAAQPGVQRGLAAGAGGAGPGEVLLVGWLGVQGGLGRAVGEGRTGEGAWHQLGLEVQDLVGQTGRSARSAP